MGSKTTINTVVESSLICISPPSPHCYETQLEENIGEKNPQNEKTSKYIKESFPSDCGQKQCYTRATKRLKTNQLSEDENNINSLAVNSDKENEAYCTKHSETYQFKVTEKEKRKTITKAGKEPNSNSKIYINIDGEDNELFTEEESAHSTDLDTVLLWSISEENTESAIREYETMRTAKDGTQELKSGLNQTSNIDHHGSDNWTKGRSSIYVDAFNLALETVLQDEGHLFNSKELVVFVNWRRLDYEAQYLYVRLFLRKSSAWHRISSLKYYGDISDLSAAVMTLQCPRDLSQSYIQTVFDTDLADLTSKEEVTELGPSFTFADSSTEKITTLEEALSLLSLEELKIISKDAKVGGKNKSEIYKALCKTSKCQSSLGWKNMKTGTSSNEWDNQSDSDTICSHELDNTIPDRRPDQYFYQKALKLVGPCIRLSLPTLKVFERVHLVFYRSTEWTEKSFITMILARISRRNFPHYIISRSANIFENRSDLLEYETALQMQFNVDQLLIETARNRSNQGERFKKILAIVDQVYPRWKILVEKEKNQANQWSDKITSSNNDNLLPDISGEASYLRRFSPAWVYTRILHKGLYVLGRLKQYEREYDIISELLNQTFFHPARRGPWYKRKALLEEHYMYQFSRSPPPTDAESQKKHWKRIALSTCEKGLQDNDCHQVFHYDLQKRICKLEKQIKIAKREKHDFAHVLLCKPIDVWIEGIQVVKENSTANSAISNNDHLGEIRSKGRNTKTIWIDEVEGGGECSVEAMCLSSYRTRGYKGFHAEGGILLTLFAYLFYDILFLYVPNVFQTAYQTCPLDLFSDNFYPSRVSEINHRLVAIENGAAPQLIQTVDQRERHKRTCVVGLNWDYATQDLLELVGCVNPCALAMICRVLAQEYRIRRGGLPDLIMWHVAKREVIFAEVKSVNDRLSETQRLWIHVLTSAGLKVELCHAVAKEVRRVNDN
ncbi:Fanconi-associated nuclease 1-like protein [Erysiphe neolycopersici]|uniref:Fanconi-associated nuclease n=1 Tax=Erysiphe neolycopersici TaxID=212602 RepID=A0A420I091_9PEZI|nr:Fanconi-associated nuclease 1-like protein [Erysiphe neolycopersici]